LEIGSDLGTNLVPVPEGLDFAGADDLGLPHASIVAVPCLNSIQSTILKM
jgi:hypothetical protein